MAASLVLVYLRSFILQRIAPRDGYEPGTLPLPSYYGFAWFFKYAAILVLIHHLFYFVIESFSVENFIRIVVTTLGSTLFTLVIMALLCCLHIKRNVEFKGAQGGKYQ